MTEPKTDPPQKTVSWKGWLALFLLLLLLSGAFTDSQGPLSALDFANLAGSFGRIYGELNFIGAEGSGARNGFLLSLQIAPVVILFCGLLDVAQSFGALEAACRLFQPLLRGLLGLPGEAGLAFTASLTSVDVGAVMTRELFDQGLLTEEERTIFASYQTGGSALLTNLRTTGAPLVELVPCPFALVFGVCMLCKFLGANLMRWILYLDRGKGGQGDGRDGKAP